MENWLQRSELILGESALKKLKNSHVLIVGLGGVGGYASEFLVRSGIGKLTIVDGDVVDETNINRQMPAMQSTVNRAKTEVVRARLEDISNFVEIKTITEFLSPQRMDEVLDDNKFDYIMDCIDSVSPKLSLIRAAKKQRIKIVSSMGAGGKTDPAKVLVRDISKTQNCFLARQIRKRLKKEKINKGIRCVFSTEIQQPESLQMTDGKNYKRSFYGTVSYMPALFGLYAAAEVIKHITGKDD